LYLCPKFLNFGVLFFKHKITNFRELLFYYRKKFKQLQKVNYPKARKGSQIVGYEERKRATNLFKEELHYEKCPNKEK